MQGKQFADVLSKRLTETGLRRIANKHTRVAIPKVARSVKAGRKSRRRLPPYWDRVRSQIYLMICTNDKRYASFRKPFPKGLSQTAIVGAIAAKVSS
jgi:hypothetical protein